MKNLTYLQATDYLDGCLVFGIKPGLSRIKKVIEILGYPKQKTDFIHIVGTNGKTSSAIITANILHSQGLKSGYHISPHITDYTERLWYCGNQIKKARFAKLLTDLFPVIEEVNSMDLEGPLTQFEIIAAMAFKLAVDEHLDVMVLEAGLGGRWDATNAVDSKVVGLTTVSLEHTDILGKTIKEISMEKSKVIKQNALVATLSRESKVLEVLKEQVLSTCSKLYLFGKDFCINHKKKMFLKGWEIDVSGVFSRYKDIVLPLTGNYQPQNLSLALVLSELYMDWKGFRIESDALKSGLKKLKVKGRFQIIKKDPVVIADTSHNPEGIKNFINNINENFYNKRKIIIFSVLKDKDYKRMLESIISLPDILILTSSNVQRSLPVDTLKEQYYKIVKDEKNHNIKKPSEVYIRDSIINSLNYALNIAARSDIICITGSITNLEKIV
ncbi:MAG: hypothetical protein JW997_05415 [Actinobacteria bacterium]|nr:hypothetical protein [Actinomycetota bacterium]